MPNWNPNFPEVLGNEALFTRHQANRVWAGAPARMQRLPSTATEAIDSLHLSATVDPLLRAGIPTVIDVIEEGEEVVPLFQESRLIPNGDDTNEGWTTHTGSSSNLFAQIDDDTVRWPTADKVAESTWIGAKTPMTAYSASVNASAFAGAGSHENARIGWVSVSAIMSANTGFRKLGLALEIDGTLYPPAAGGVRDVHIFGAIYTFWWGELNPSTELPWTPADIADFDTGGVSRLFVRSQAAATASHFPRVHALRLNVHWVNPENRVAVGVWRRPDDIGTALLQNIETDALLSLPDGTAGWSKPSGVNHLYYWRHCVSPAQYGAVVAPDVRWNGLYQDLGPGGQPAGVVYPLHSSGASPPPSTVLAGRTITHDSFGRPQATFDGRSRAVYGIALERSDAAISVDSQPYRLAQPPSDFNLSDMERLTSTQKLGQRVTMPSTQSYLGVRFPILPPPLGLDATLTVAVHRVSDGAQMGGNFQITADQARALPVGALPPATHSTRGGIRYVSGFLSSGATLSSGVAYEIRMTTDSGANPYGWIAFVPDCSLGASAGFGGSTNGAFIGATHHSDRELVVNLIRQPDPPTGLTVAITNVPVTTYVPDITTVEHVAVSWTLPATGMGGLFSHYEVERQLDGGPWHQIARINTSSLDSLPDDDHEVPRDTEARYRIRAVGNDGRISDWAVSNAVTPTAPGAIVILTSNHRPDLEAVYVYDPESSYPLLSTESDETVAIHGVDYQVVFMEDEDRGIGWRTRITINQLTLQGKGGQHVLGPLVAITRSIEVPYVAALDHQGSVILGHVTASEITQQQPLHRYTAQIEAVPTHAEPVPVEVT